MSQNLENVIQRICPDGLVRVMQRDIKSGTITFRLQDVYAYSVAYSRPGIDDRKAFRIYLPSQIVLEVYPSLCAEDSALDVLLNEWLLDERDPYGKPIKEKGARK